ncbi:MAG: hypothetical protein WBZ00_15000 [Solirubrobacterales bacterium]|jgi:hypothetical protein
MNEQQHHPALQSVVEPLRTQILEEAEEKGAVREVAVAADGVLVTWGSGAVEFYGDEEGGDEEEGGAR